jgi:hypothetical protein
MFPQEMIFEEKKPACDNPTVEQGDRTEEDSQDACPFACTTFQNDINGKLFEGIEETAHRVSSLSPCWHLDYWLRR